MHGRRHARDFNTSLAVEKVRWRYVHKSIGFISVVHGALEIKTRKPTILPRNPTPSTTDKCVFSQCEIKTSVRPRSKSRNHRHTYYTCFSRCSESSATQSKRQSPTPIGFCGKSGVVRRVQGEGPGGTIRPAEDTIFIVKPMDV